MHACNIGINLFGNDFYVIKHRADNNNEQQVTLYKYHRGSISHLATDPPLIKAGIVSKIVTLNFGSTDLQIYRILV